MLAILEERLLKVKADLKDKVHPYGVDFIYSILERYIEYSKSINQKSSIKNLIERLPSYIVYNCGFLSHSFLSQSKINDYKSIGIILDTMITYKVFNYDNGESISDFDIDNDLLSDVTNSLKNYKSVVCDNMEYNIKQSYANSGRT